MLLAADVGNTEIVLGVFQGEDLAHTWRISTQAERTADELALVLSGFLSNVDIAFESLGDRAGGRVRRAGRDRGDAGDGVAVPSHPAGRRRAGHEDGRAGSHR